MEQNELYHRLLAFYNEHEIEASDGLAYSTCEIVKDFLAQKFTIAMLEASEGAPPDAARIVYDLAENCGVIVKHHKGDAA